VSICYALQRAGSPHCTRRIGANSNFTSREISFTWTNWLAYLAGSVRGDLAYPREGNLQLVVEEVSVSARILVHHRKAVGGQFSKPSGRRKKLTRSQCYCELLKERFSAVFVHVALVDARKRVEHDFCYICL